VTDPCLTCDAGRADDPLRKKATLGDSLQNGVESLRHLRPMAVFNPRRLQTLFDREAQTAKVVNLGSSKGLLVTKCAALYLEDRGDAEHAFAHSRS